MMDESTAEKMWDALVQDWCRSDHAYAHAENAEEQAEAERAISIRAGQHLAAKYPNVDFFKEDA